MHPVTTSAPIPKDALIAGRFYFGEGRFVGGIGLWNGVWFLGFQFKFNDYLETTADYGEKGFSPLREMR